MLLGSIFPKKDVFELVANVLNAINLSETIFWFPELSFNAPGWISTLTCLSFAVNPLIVNWYWILVASLATTAISSAVRVIPDSALFTYTLICSGLSSVAFSPANFRYLSYPFNVITEVPFNAASNVVWELTFDQTGSTKSTTTLSVVSGSFFPIVNVLFNIVFPYVSIAIGVASEPVNTIST